jgi:hypothetical protein
MPWAQLPVAEQLGREGNLELRLRMSGAVPPFPAMTSRYVQAKLYLLYQMSGVSKNRIRSPTAAAEAAHSATYLIWQPGL